MRSSPYYSLKENRYMAFMRVALDVYNWLIPLTAINILWFLMSLTVILLPPATAALYETAFLVTRGEGPHVTNFLKAVYRWLWRAWLWGAATALFIVAGLFAGYFYGALGSDVGSLMASLAIGITFFVLLVQFYFWPYMLVQEQPSILHAFRNAMFTVLGDPFYALWNAVITAVLLAVGVALIVPVVIIIPVVIAFFGTYSLHAWLYHRGLMPEPPQVSDHLIE